MGRLTKQGQRLSLEQRRFALESYEAGEKLVFVAHLVGCTESAVCKMAARAGVPPRRPRTKRK